MRTINAIVELDVTKLEYAQQVVLWQELCDLLNVTDDARKGPPQVADWFEDIWIELENPYDPH